MALSKRKIIEEIERGAIWVGVDREHKASLSKLSFDSVSLELHLHNEFKVWKALLPGEKSSVDPSASGFDLAEYAAKYTIEGRIESDGAFQLESKEFVLCKTLEYIKLPEKYFARVEGKSKLARLGLTIHNTAPTIQADWGGRITLEIFNHSPIPVRLKPGLTIAQLIFEEIAGELEPRSETFSSNQDSTFGQSMQKTKHS